MQPEGTNLELLLFRLEGSPEQPLPVSWYGFPQVQALVKSSCLQDDPKWEAGALVYLLSSLLSSSHLDPQHWVFHALNA